MATPRQEIKELADEILKVQKEYAEIYRFVLNPRRFNAALAQGIVGKDDLSSMIMRESVLEHVGHLPLIASTIYPYLEHASSVDLAKTLLYLSIHEAPERVTGDKVSFHKTSADEEEELAAARGVFTNKYEKYLVLYEDFHFIRNIDAQFAVSVDKLAPFFYYEFLEPRFRRFSWQPNGITWQMVSERHAPLMAWDRTTKELFEYIIETIKDQDGETNKN